jgi:hypothetical protein
MSNPLFNQMQQNNIVSEFERFCANFKGDPKAAVERLLASGQMTQQQFNQIQAMATQFQRLLPKR